MKINSIYNFIKNKKLTEELHIDGLNFLGNAYGYDVYDVKTWAAAQSLVTNDDSETPAGQAYTSTEDIFNRNIGERLHLYVFVYENTNKVRLASINQNSGILNVKDKCSIQILNYSFEGRTAEGQSSTTNTLENNEIIPFFLLPDVEYKGFNGLIFNDSKTAVIGTYNGFIDPSNVPTEVVIPEPINSIAKPNAFKDFAIRNVIIENYIQSIVANAFKGYTGTIRCAVEEPEEAPWADNWNGDCQDIVWGIHLSPEEIARREEAARIEREKIERDRQLQAAPVEEVLRFKKEKNEITIIGCKPGRHILEIPAEIDNCPVTKIAPYSFYNHKELERVVLPNTVKEIGKAAFYNCSNLTLYYPKTAILYTDAIAKIWSKKAQ